ncbi:MAG: ATP-dependent nuclease [Christensenellales bacterium]
MKVESIHIQKFRSIDDAIIIFDQVLAVVGANNVGKSHILRALNAFFNYQDEQEAFVNHDHVFSLKSRPKITIVFRDLTEKDNIPTEYIYSGKLTIKFTYRWDRSSPTYEVIKGVESQTINAETFHAFIKHFRFIYVPVIRHSESSFSTEYGIAYNLLNSIVKQQVSKRNTLQPLVKGLYNKIQDTVFKTAIKRIKQYYPFKEKVDFKLQIKNNDPIDSIIHDVTLEFIENSKSNDIKNCGSGVQSAIYFAITLAAAMDDEIFYMVGIEEPELNMHPQAQQKLIESLKDTKKYPSTQFVLTTHSTVVIDHLGHKNIALCKKIKGPTRDIVTTVNQIKEDFWDKYDIAEERYSSFFEYKNSEFFFSDYVIITESTIDCGIITKILEESGIIPSEMGITFIPANGETSIKYPYAIVKELQIPFFCVVDRDVFQPYTGEKRKDSINEQGLPMYKSELKTSSAFCGLLSDGDKNFLLNKFISGEYSEILNVLDKYSIVCMKYAIEIDLLICPSFLKAYCEVLGINGANRTAYYLATERGTVIKKLDTIRQVLDLTTTKNLPASYKKIIKNVRDWKKLNSM